MVSAVRHLVAFDMFYKEHDDDCDLADADNRELFIENVRKIVNIEDDIYTTNFYTTLKPLYDCGVGSNFFSAGVVKNSRENTRMTYDYPTRGQYPLFQVKNYELIRNPQYYKNLSNYLFNDSLKSAFIIWLLRTKLLEEINISFIQQSLKRFLTNELVDELLPKAENFNSFIEGFELERNVARLSEDEIMSIFIRKEKGHVDSINPSCRPFLTAIRTKPFLLLAGISGTGKSRIVRKLAQATDDIDVFAKDEDRWRMHSPANFELIQVKPNWHNSMDVVGFQSNIPEPHYEFTPFVDFVVKAWLHPETPFLLCLDEMNLAPVEEYFAEFLSAIESRSIGEEGEIETDPIIKPFDNFGADLSGKMMRHFLDMGYDIPSNVEKRLRKKGLTLPKNLIVMGTVNMDETTFSFSRKVLDRAMSIEMNEVNYDDFIEGKTEYDMPQLTDLNDLLVNRPISAQEVKDNIEAKEVMNFLKGINNILEGTPFKLGYRAANEAILYVAADKVIGADNLNAALDDFTLMKILSRIEGDDSKLVTQQGDKLLDKLYDLLNNDDVFGTLENSKSLAKLKNMRDTLNRDHFVSFWG